MLKYITRLKIPFIISVFLILSPIVFLKADSEEIDRMVLRGLDHCYNFRWDDGDEIFNRIIKKYPADPRGYHYKSTIYLWYYLSTGNEEDYENFLKYSNITIDKSEILLEAEKDRADIKYVLGTNYSCRAMIFTKAGSYLDAIWASKTSETLLSEVIEKEPDNYDAYLGLGLYSFAVDQIPTAFKWALNLAGISGNEVKGLAYIKKTADKGRFTFVEARYYLSQILSEVKMDYDEAGEYLRKLIARYPRNLLFSYSLGVLEIKKRRLANAGRYISNVLKNKDKKFSQLNSLAEFLMGDINFKRNNFEEAAQHYLEFLNTAFEEDYTGIASFRLALCMEMINDRNTALIYYNGALTGNPDLDDDRFAARKASIYLQREITSNEKSVIRFMNLVEAGEYKAASDSLAAMLEYKMSDKLRAEVLLYLSDASYHAGNAAGSTDYALQVISLYTDEEKWIRPFACYYAARGYAETGNWDLVNHYLDEAADFSGYDYEKKLEHILESFKESFKPDIN